MVYVISKNGQPLMPTENHAKVRVLLKNKKAEVIKRCPFTIQLAYESTNYTQPVSLGIDAGSKTIGVSATTEKTVLYEAEVVPRDDISKLLEARRELRSSRRNRKTRYRKKRFDNRKRDEGWLAPSVRQKVETHLTTVDKVMKMLPVSRIRVETASFDIQKIKAMEEDRPLPEGTDYQQGELLGFANLREYCFWRDNYTCQWCHGKSGSKILHMHHWNYWNGDHTDKPSSVITLCDVCNDSKNHKRDGFLWGWKPKITKSYKDAAFMGIMRWAFYNELKERYGVKGIPVSMTYGYITKNTRIENGLSKAHHIDARCISGNPQAVSDGTVYFQKKVRCHNRQIHKCTIKKGGIRPKNQSEYIIKGFRLYDKVQYQGKEYFIFGKRTSGFFDIRTLDGNKVNNGSVSCRKLKLLEKPKNYLTERRTDMGYASGY